MTSSSVLPSDEELAALGAVPAFYVVSKRKLVILYLSTFTLYALYWFYKNWDRYKGKHPEASRFGTTVWPVPRAAFSVFFTHALFRKIKEYGRRLPEVAGWHSGWMATITVAWMAVSGFIDLPIGGKAGDIVSIACIFPLLIPLLQAQHMINLGCGDPTGQGNARLTWANRVWIALGALVWVFILIGLFLTDGA
jgi:hypothetical protein